MNNDKPWTIRAAQLDLARQKETVETIADFSRFIADAGYNTLLLYMEAIVRTPSFHELPEAMSYSTDEIRRIVRTAGDAGLEVVPCISTLGHAEHFFLVDRMKPLAEAVQGQRLMTFCTANPDTYTFLERYLSEVAELFPAPHFHVGLDEAWQMGRCPRCRPRARRDGGFMGIYSDHVLRMHEIVSGLGKRMWMWDDLLEYASDEQVARLPRDILMCMWNYNSQSVHRRCGLQGHFNQLHRHNALARYERLGFDALVAPGASGVRHIYELTQYGRNYPVAGGLMTIWELGQRFLPGTLPMFMFGGLLWDNPDLSEAEAVDRMIDRLFPADLSADERQAIAALSLELVTGATQPAALLRGPLSLYEHHMLAANTLYEQILQRLLRRPELSVLQRRMLEEMAIRATSQRIGKQFAVAQQELIDPGSRSKSAAAGRVRGLAGELRQLAQLRSRQWQEQRPGIEPDKAGAAVRKLAESYDTVAETWSQSSPGDLLVEIGLFLWDGYSAPRLRVELISGGKETVIADGSFKPQDLRQSQYTIQVPLRREPDAPPPDAVRLTVSAHGGQGIRFVRLLTADRCYEPADVVATSGAAVNPRASLIDNSDVCYLGSTDTTATLMAQAEHVESSLTLSLAPVAHGQHSTSGN